MTTLRAMTLAGLLAMLLATTVQAHPHPLDHRLHHGSHSARSYVLSDTVVTRHAPVSVVRENIVATLPAGAVRITQAGSRIYLHEGRFYTRKADGFVRIMPVRGLRIATLPAGYVTVRSAGVLRYRYAGVTYRKVKNYYVVV